jgi:ferrochelatase
VNAEPAWIRALGSIAVRHLAGWPTEREVDPQALARSREDAKILGATR